MVSHALLSALPSAAAGPRGVCRSIFRAHQFRVVVLRHRGRRIAAADRGCIRSLSSDAASSTMQAVAYRSHSVRQYGAHLGCSDMLRGCMERLAARTSFEDSHTADGPPRRRRRIADLGSADGSNSMQTLREALEHLRQSAPAGGRATMPSTTSAAAASPPLHVTFEEHPLSDEHELESVLSENEEWFRRNDITHSVLMKSFYEPLFKPGEMDFIMSHICLHWLDTADVPNDEEGVSSWKSMLSDRGGNASVNTAAFTMMNEGTVPSELREEWRTELARVHLAKFLALRSAELRPGGEMLLMMVANPSGFVAPPSRPAPKNTAIRSKEGADVACPLTTAMRRCVDRGVVREEVLRRTLVPYYCRTVDDVREAFEMAASIDLLDPIDADYAPPNPGSLLELVDVRSYPVAVGGGGDETSVDGLFKLWRAIHLAAVKATGRPTEEELGHIEAEAWLVFEETYDAEEGAEIHYIACIARRRTRRQWSSSNIKAVNS